MNDSLLSAASAGQTNTVDLLLRQGDCNVNCLSPEGNTPLMLACYNGHVETVNKLIQHHAQIECVNYLGKTALMMAAQEGHVTVASVLLDYQIYTVDFYNDNLETALTEACHGGHLEMVRLLLAAKTGMDNIPCELSASILKASLIGNPWIVETLINHGASVNKDPNFNESPLTASVISDSIEVQIILIEHNADIHEVNSRGYTPLQEAVRGDKRNMVAYLISQGSDINVVTLKRRPTPINTTMITVASNATVIHNGYSLLMDAARRGHAEIGLMLINADANVNIVANFISSSDTALKLAVISGKLDFVHILLMKNAIVDCIDKQGNTPLWYAARSGYLDIIQLLHRYGANLNFRNVQSPPQSPQATILTVAVMNGHINVVSWLTKRIIQFPTNVELSYTLSSLSDDLFLQNCFIMCIKNIFRTRDQRLRGINLL